MTDLALLLVAALAAELILLDQLDTLMRRPDYRIGYLIGWLLGSLRARRGGEHPTAVERPRTPMNARVPRHLHPFLDDLERRILSGDGSIPEPRGILYSDGRMERPDVRWGRITAPFRAPCDDAAADRLLAECGYPTDPHRGSRA